MHLPRSVELPVADDPPARADHPAPVAAPEPAAHPDRGMLRQFLRELRLPLAAVQTMLELATDGTPDAVQLAVRAAANHTDYLLDLVADYHELDRLGAEGVTAQPERVEPDRWIDACLAVQRHKSAQTGIELRVQHRSFLPSHVDLDGTLAARAVDAVLRVATQRALPGPVEVRVGYAFDPQAPAHARLLFDVVTRGGGFADLEQGYVFTPFAVRDASARPLLGLGNAHRLCRLLGGELRVSSPGPSVCTYALTFLAPPCGDARWVDPVAGDEQRFGAVRPRRPGE